MVIINSILGSSVFKPSTSSSAAVPRSTSIFAPQASSTSTARPIVASSIIRPAASLSPSKPLFASSFKPVPPKPVAPKPVFNASEASPLLVCI